MTPKSMSSTPIGDGRSFRIRSCSKLKARIACRSARNKPAALLFHLRAFRRQRGAARRHGAYRIAQGIDHREMIRTRHLDVVCIDALRTPGIHNSAALAQEFGGLHPPDDRVEYARVR